jgi:small multidrug resistance pump
MTPTTTWLLLALCIVAEVTATTLLTLAQGFARPWHGAAALLLFAGCFAVMSQVLTQIPVGVAYAVWSGAGMALISLVGWQMLGQPLSWPQLGCIALITVGTVGLNVVGRG